MKKIIIYSLPLALLATFGNYSFAEDVDLSYGSHHFVWSWAQQSKPKSYENSLLEEFIDTQALTSAQQQEIKDIEAKYKNDKQLLLSEAKWLSGNAQEDLKSKMQELTKTFYSDMRSYVSSEDLSSYDEFVNKVKDGKRQWNMNNWSNIHKWSTAPFWTWQAEINNNTTQSSSKDKNSYIKWSTYDSVTKTLSTFSNEQLNMLLTKIDGAVQSLQSSNKENAQMAIAIYSEIRSLVEDLLQEENKVDMSFLDDLLK